MFDPISLIGLVAGSTSNLFNIGGSFLSSAMQFKHNKELQDRAFAHQINMYKHQHQWEVDDLRQAGLNPILSTHSGASMPSAPSASVSAPDFSFANFDKDLFSALSGRLKRENSLLDAQIKEVKARTAEVSGRAKVTNAVGDVADEGMDLFNSAKKVASELGNSFSSVIKGNFSKSIPSSGFSAKDEEFLDSLLEEEARKGRQWYRDKKNRVVIFKKAK